MDSAALAALLANPPPNDYIGDRVIIALCVTTFFILVTLGLRLYSRIVLTKATGWDDYTSILATCVVIINFAFNALDIHYGGGRHFEYIEQTSMYQALKWSNLAMFPFIFCTCITKLSIAFMVLRLTNKNWMRYYMYALMASLILINGGCLVVLLAYCRPTHAFWDVTVKDAKCWNPKVLQAASNVQGAWSIVTDVILTTIPIVMVWQLQMASKQKIVVTTLVGFGLVTTACCSVRVYYYAHENFGLDSTWTSTNTTMWTVLEENIGLISANLPALGQFRKIVAEKISNSSLRYLLSRSSKSMSRSKATLHSESEVEMVGKGYNVSQRLKSVDENSLRAGAIRKTTVLSFSGYPQNASNNV